MTCPSELQLSIYADGELPEVEAQLLSAHLEACPGCRGVFDSLRVENASLMEAFREEERSMPRLHASSVSKSWVWALVAAAAATPLFFEMAWQSLPSLPAGFHWLGELGGPGGIWALFRTLSEQLVGGEDMWASSAAFALTTLGAVGALGLVVLRQRAALMPLAAAVMLLLGHLALPSQALADEVRSEMNGRVEVPASETLDDTVVLQGRTVIVAGVVNGDVVAAGDRIEISGVVHGNLYAAGETVAISGRVDGNIHCIGGELDVDGSVGGSVLLVGQNVLLTERGSIGRTAYVAGESVRLKGKVGRALLVGARKVDLSGKVERSFRGWAKSFAFSAGSIVGGDLLLTVPSNESVEIDREASIGGARRIELRPHEERSDLQRGGYYLGVLARTIALLLFAMLLVTLFPTLSPSEPRSAMGILRTLGVGFIAVFATPVAILVIALTVIGLPLSVLLGMAYMLLAYLSTIVVAYFLAQRWPVLEQAPIALRTGLTLAVLLVITKIPWIGPGLGFLICLFGVGSLVTHLRSLYARSDEQSGAAV